MIKCKLTLTASLGKIKNEKNIELTEENSETSIFDYEIDRYNVVYSDMCYSAYLNINLNEEIKNVVFYVNDTEINCIYSNGSIEFKDNSIDEVNNIINKKIFVDCYGFVKISILIITNSTKYLMVSKAISVYVRPEKLQISIERMMDFINNNYEEYLYNNQNHPYRKADLTIGEYKSLEMQIKILEEIVYVYTELFVYFKSDAKFKIKTNITVDSFEKVKNISCNTIQYIVTHPEELTLTDVNTGITYFKQHMYPLRTMVSSNTYTRNIYENQVITSFLKYLIREVTTICDNINELVNNHEIKTNILENYVSSAMSIYKNMSDKLKKHNSRLELLLLKIKELYIIYKDTLEVSDIVIERIPKPTSIFLNVIQYRKIFDSIIKWFNYGLYDLSQEKFMFSFLMTHKLYEYYVLVKFLLGIKKLGLKKEKYSMFPYKKYKSNYNMNINDKINNTFIFKSENKIVTFYFQPIVSNCEENDINIYRNTTISYPKDNDIHNGIYYNPDYLIKFEENGISKYLVMDAKYSQLKNAKQYSIPELTFKYLISMSTKKQTDKILGLYIINGKLEENQKDGVFNIYNNRNFIDVSKNMQPIIRILTLTESTDDSNIEHEKLLSDLILECLK